MYGVALDVNTLRVIHNMKMSFSNKSGGFQVNRMARLFHEADKPGLRLLPPCLFEDVLKQVGIIYRSADIQALARYFDREGNNMIDYHEFLGKFR